MVQSRAEPWENGGSSRPKCDLTSQLCIVAERRFAKKVLQQRLSPWGAFKYVLEPPEGRAARDVASAAVNSTYRQFWPARPAARAPALTHWSIFSGGARGRRAPLVVHDGALRAQPSIFPPPFPSPPSDVRDRTNLERRLIDDDDGAAPASHYSTIASHRDLRRCHDGGTARPRSPRARPTSSLRERPGRVRSCSSSPLDLTSGRAGPWAPRPSGSERSSSRPSCSSCTVYPHIVLLLPRVSFPLLPSAHKELHSK